jgi:hypothetical protein
MVVLVLVLLVVLLVEIEMVAVHQTEKEVLVEVHQIENHLVATQTEQKETVHLKEAQVVKENQVMQEEYHLIQNRNSKRKVGNKYD